MATQSPATSGASRACPVDSISQVYESGDEVVVLVRLHDGVLELRVPRASVATEKTPEHIPGLNADATPC
jgi:hypothetical protein